MERTEPTGLVAAARAGDQDSWARLYRHAYPRLIAFAHRRLQDPDLAAEVVSETMLRAVTAIRSYSGDDRTFTPWLIGICRHVIADAQRALYRRRLPPSVMYQDAELPSPMDIVLADEERILLRAAFERLDPDERELLELRVVAGLSSAEAAAVLGKQPGSVRVAQHRALSRLRIFVQEVDRAIA